MSPENIQILWNGIVKLKTMPYKTFRGETKRWNQHEMHNLLLLLIPFIDTCDLVAIWNTIKFERGRIVVANRYFDKIRPSYARELYQLAASLCGSTEITIGTQVWTTKNLNVSTYRNGDPIPYALNQEDWDIAALDQTGAYRYYNDDPSTEAIYGKWYNSYAMQDPRNIAPVGYHIPTVYEYNQLDNYLTSQSLTFGSLKDIIPGLWDAPNAGANNEYQYQAVPGGGILPTTGSYNKGKYGYYWIYTMNPAEPFGTSFGFDTDVYTGSGATTPGNGLTARLIADSSLVLFQLFGGGTILSINSNLITVVYSDNDGQWLPPKTLDWWGCAGVFIGADNTDNGQFNTDIFKASACSNIGLLLQDPGSMYINGYNDWYVPSKGEFENFIATANQDRNLHLHRADIYWTSTELNANQAVAMRWTGSQWEGILAEKSETYCVPLMRIHNLDLA